MKKYSKLIFFRLLKLLEISKKSWYFFINSNLSNVPHLIFFLNEIENSCNCLKYVKTLVAIFGIISSYPIDKKADWSFISEVTCRLEVRYREPKIDRYSVTTHHYFPLRMWYVFFCSIPRENMEFTSFNWQKSEINPNQI